jgi:integrase
MKNGKTRGKRQLTSSHLLASSNIAILPLVSPMYVLGHALRHTFAFQLAKVTGADAYELERRLGHRSQRYIQRYTNPPEQVAASYVEGF